MLCTFIFDLSVPSKRVESLQPGSAASPSHHAQTFITLQACRVAATSTPPRIATKLPTLSVPSKRVESLQPPVSYRKNTLIIFVYSDRSHSLSIVAGRQRCIDRL